MFKSTLLKKYIYVCIFFKPQFHSSQNICKSLCNLDSLPFFFLCNITLSVIAVSGEMTLFQFKGIGGISVK